MTTMSKTGKTAVEYYQTQGEYEIAAMIQSIDNQLDHILSLIDQINELNTESPEPDVDHLYDSWIESNLCDQYEASLL